MAKKDGTKSALVVAAGKSDLIASLEAVKQEIAKFKKIEESVYKTPGRLAGFNQNIQEMTDVSELIKLLSSVKARQVAYEQTAETELDMPKYPVFKLEGHTFADWKSDVQLRIAIIEQKSTLDELKELKEGFEGLMDKEDKMLILNSKLAKFAEKHSSK